MALCALGLLAGAAPPVVEEVALATVSRPAETGAISSSSGGVHTVGGCQVFPPDNPWNTRIDQHPVHPRSAAIVARQAAGHVLHLDLGSTEEYYGIPVNVAADDQARLPLRFGVEGEDYRDESDRGPVPTPTDADIEGGRAKAPDPEGGDRHVVTVQQGRCELVELYRAERVYDAAGEVVAWRAAAAARWDLGSNRLRPAGWTSADAAGLPILPGLLSYEEAASGRITHALRFTLPTARAAYVRPARHCGPRGNSSATLPSYGLRFRLEAGFGTTSYTGPARAIVVAMKRYGLMYADQGSSMFVTGTSDPRWAEVLEQFRAHPVDGSRFEVVRTGRVTRC